nr:PREDICTED: uncharacterized protein LOC103973645 isoform X1 [Musa acuminata subsp. malaccensis]
MSSLPSGISWKVRLWCYNKANILEPPSARIFVPSVALGFTGFTIWILLIRMPLFGVIFSFSVKNLIFMSLVVFSFLNKAGTVINMVFPEGYLQVSDVQTTTLGVCTYPRSPALALGLIAAVALMIAQAIINTVSGCICCKKYPNPSDTNWTIGLISFIASWVTFIIAFVLLLSGAALNDQWGQERMYFGEYCYVVRSGVFSGGAVLSLASVALGIVYYVSSSSPKNMQPWSPQQNQGIALGQPQIPPQVQTTPVFVHEDTYIRQQFP